MSGHRTANAEIAKAIRTLAPDITSQMRAKSNGERLPWLDTVVLPLVGGLALPGGGGATPW
eukprot:3364399-Rhodomonas_salina.1